jgi:hypothetical protein
VWVWRFASVVLLAYDCGGSPTGETREEMHAAFDNRVGDCNYGRSRNLWRASFCKDGEGVQR